MKRIRIAYVINDLLLGGAQMTVLGLVQNLDKDQFVPTVYYLNEYEHKRTLFGRFEETGVRIVRIGGGVKTSITQAISILRTEWKTSRPDIVHCHLPDAVISGGVVAAFSRTPFIIHEHQTHAAHSLKIRLAYRILRPFARLTICYADSVAKELFGMSHPLRSRIDHINEQSYTIYNGLDRAAILNGLHSKTRNEVRASLSINPSDVLVLSVARLVSWKGHANLIDAFGLIKERFPHAWLLIVGDGPLHAELEAKARAYDTTGDRIRLLGARADVYDLLAASDVFSLVLDYPEGKESEAIGIAGLEAMAAGLPVIIGDYPSAESFVRDGIEGFVVKPHDPEALSVPLARLIDDARERNEVGMRASESVRYLAWSAMIDVYHGLYEAILRRV